MLFIKIESLKLTSLLVCTLVTCVWGLILYVEYAIRAWKLAYRWSANRPLNSTHIALTERQSDRNESTPIEISQEEISIRQPSAVPLLPSHWYHDASHWLFSVTLTITLAELIIATVPKDPYIRLLAMVNPSMLFSISLFIFVLDVGYFLNMHAPFRISSLARGEYIRPGIYTLLEDVAAVDIGGGYTFRTEFNEHWETNAIFRRLLWKLSIFWSLPGLFVSVVCTAVIFTRDTEVGFAVGWGLPFIWAILWTVVTMGVTRGLNREKTSTQAAN